MEAWKEILDLKTDDPLEIMGYVGRVYTLPNAVQRAVERIPELDHALHLGWKPDLDKALREMMWNANIQQFTQHLSDSLLVSLAFVSENLGRLAPEKVLDDKELETIRDEAWSLFDRIDQSSLDEPGRGYLLKQLGRLIQALDDYPFFGIQPLEIALDGVVGSVITDSRNAQETRGGEEDGMFWRLAGRVALLLKITHAVLQIGESAVDLLEIPVDQTDGVQNPTDD